MSHEELDDPEELDVEDVENSEEAEEAEEVDEPEEPEELENNMAFVHLACGGGLGYLKPGPGTWGSLGAFVLALIICLIGGSWPLQLIFALLAMLSFVMGLVVTPAAQRHFERLDPSEVVIDEIHGLWLALALLPSDLLGSRTVMVCVVVFVIFRLFDICKPWPIPILERTPGAWGVMLDDSLAGLLAGIATLVLVQ